MLISHVILYFSLEENAAKATSNIDSVYGVDSSNESNYQRCFQWFRKFIMFSLAMICYV